MQLVDTEAKITSNTDNALCALNGRIDAVNKDLAATQEGLRTTQSVLRRHDADMEARQKDGASHNLQQVGVNTALVNEQAELQSAEVSQSIVAMDLYSPVKLKQNASCNVLHKLAHEKEPVKGNGKGNKGKGKDRRTVRDGVSGGHGSSSIAATAAPEPAKSRPPQKASENNMTSADDDGSGSDDHGVWSEAITARAEVLASEAMAHARATWMHNAVK